MIPARDLDQFGQILLMGPLSSVEQDFESRTTKILESQDPSSNGGTSVHEATQRVCDDLYKLRWGPTQVPLFNLLGLFRILNPDQKTLYFDVARFFINQGVPVDGKDLSGTTALSHSFSTKPASDFDYAQLLYDAGGDVNERNRYGGIVAHEIATVYPPFSSDAKKLALESMKWFLSHGGNASIADADGMAPRSMCERLQRVIPELMNVVKKEEQRRKLIEGVCCTLCGSQNAKLLICSRCGKARYCSPRQRSCQKLDWPRHKIICKAPSTSVGVPESLLFSKHSSPLRSNLISQKSIFSVYGDVNIVEDIISSLRRVAGFVNRYSILVHRCLRSAVRTGL